MVLALVHGQKLKKYSTPKCFQLSFFVKVIITTRSKPQKCHQFLTRVEFVRNVPKHVCSFAHLSVYTLYTICGKYFPISANENIIFELERVWKRTKAIKTHACNLTKPEDTFAFHGVCSLLVNYTDARYKFSLLFYKNGKNYERPLNKVERKFSFCC